MNRVEGVNRASADGTPPLFPFFVGRSRSGTTLLRAIFDSHPGMAIPPEAQFLVPMAQARRRYRSPGGRFDVRAFSVSLRAHPSFGWWRISREELESAMSPPPEDFSGAIRRLYALFAGRNGKVRYGDKSPRNTENLALIASLFPEGRFVHLIRDGRDVALSQLEHGFMPSIGHAAFYWARTITRARAASLGLSGDRYLEIRYETLVSRPVETVSAICDFIELSFDEAMLRYFERADTILYPKVRHDQHVYHAPQIGLRDWRTEMSHEDTQVFEVIAGDVLEGVGYARVTPRPSLWLRLRAEFALVRVHLWRIRLAGVGCCSVIARLIPFHFGRAHR